MDPLLPTLDELARRLAQISPGDTSALTALRNELACAVAQPPLCNSMAPAAIAERVLASIDKLVAGRARSPAQALARACKLLRTAAVDARPGDMTGPLVGASTAAAGSPRREIPAPPASAPRLTSERPTQADPENVFSLEYMELSPLAAVAPETPAAAGRDQPAPPPAEAVPEEEPDWELAEQFVGEAHQYLADAEAALLHLESTPGDPNAIGTIFRAFHTIKGVSAFMGLSTVTAVAHSAETLLSRMRDGEIRCSGGYASLALSSIDVLKGLLAQVAKRVAPKMTPALDALRARLTEPEAHGIMADGVVGLLPSGVEEAEAAAAPQPGAEPVVQDTWIRVRTDRLDRLIDMVGELVIAQSIVSQETAAMVDARSGLHRKVTQADKIIRALQDLSMSLRMVPLRQTFQKVARVVRDVGQKSGRSVQFLIEGDTTEMDRNMVDVIADPLIHMARNAVDHGLEPNADARKLAGKSTQGTVRLAAIRSGGEVVLQLSDDGAGIDPARIAKKAIERGLIETAAGMAEADILALIFEPGFSTRDEVTDVSGRGVGMDVVKRGVEALKGRIEISSKIGEGTTFSLHLPLTLAITDGMLVRVGSQRYVIPSVAIRVSLRPEPKQLSTISERGEFLQLRGELVPICRLHHLFGIYDAQEDPAAGLLVVVNDGSKPVAILVDEVLGQQQVVTKALGAFWGELPGVAGGAILGDGRVGLILDVIGVAGLARQRSSHTRMRAYPTSSFELS